MRLLQLAFINIQIFIITTLPVFTIWSKTNPYTLRSSLFIKILSIKPNISLDLWTTSRFIANILSIIQYLFIRFWLFLFFLILIHIFNKLNIINKFQNIIIKFFNFGVAIKFIFHIRLLYRRQQSIYSLFFNFCKFPFLI